MIPKLASKYWWTRSFRRHAAPWGELESFPNLAPDEQRRVLATRLLEQVRYFGTRADALPEWREAARIEDPGELWRIWPELPAVTKQMLQTRFQPKEMAARFGLEGRADSTGGSTGEPTPFFHDAGMMRAVTATNYYTRLRMGWRPGMSTVIVWGSERDICKDTTFRNRVNNALFRDRLVDGYHLTRATAERVLGIIKRERPVAMYGFTSMLEFVAREILAMGAEPESGAVHCAWNGGEMLFPEQIDVFRKAFGVPILNRYGGRELSVMACQFREAGPLEVIRPWLFAEVVDDNGRPAGPGESGRLLWTSTVCRGTPFLRYDIGDAGEYRAEDHTEAGVFAISELHGRIASVLELPDGRKINAIYWNHLFKEFPEVRQFQVVIKRDRTIEILLKGAPPPEREAVLRSKLQFFLAAIPFSLKPVDTIPLTPQGKLVQVVRDAASEPAHGVRQ